MCVRSSLTRLNDMKIFMDDMNPTDVPATEPTAPEAEEAAVAAEPTAPEATT